jgi:hypothetical protein
MAKKAIRKKDGSFGTAVVNHITPVSFTESQPKALNIVLSFEEALKLHLSVGQALASLNSYDRSTKAARETGMCLHLYDHGRIMVTEAKVR